MKPILALDVDGPIVLMGKNDEDVFETVVAGVPVAIRRSLPPLLRELAQHFQILWATSWERKASEHLAPVLGLPVGLPYLRFGRHRPGESRKLPVLRAALKQHPAALVDDEIDQDLRAWANARQAPTLLVTVDPRAGLQESHVQLLLEFAGEWRCL